MAINTSGAWPRPVQFDNQQLNRKLITDFLPYLLTLTNTQSCPLLQANAPVPILILASPVNACSTAKPPTWTLRSQSNAGSASMAEASTNKIVSTIFSEASWVPEVHLCLMSTQAQSRPLDKKAMRGILVAELALQLLR